jgi:hypothetical protein
MIYRVDSSRNTLQPCDSAREIKELELEELLVNQSGADGKLLSSDVFGEELLYITRQHYTRDRKRTDIIAMDRWGSLVVIEMKRDHARLGVETQALQYLADLSSHRGRNVLRAFPKVKDLDERVGGFLGSSVSLDSLNTHPRVILLARDFDEAILSMGEWLSGQGISFRCISYAQTRIANNIYISFSVRFDRSPRNLHRVSFARDVREPGMFWLNVGDVKKGRIDWWKHLRSTGQIACGFSNRHGDRGTEILSQFVPGDRIVAYASGHGAIGWGVIPQGASYRLLLPGDPEDVTGGEMLHRLPIRWRATAKHIGDAISPAEFEKQTGIYHPLSTSSSIDAEKGERLVEILSQRFGDNG